MLINILSSNKKPRLFDEPYFQYQLHRAGLYLNYIQVCSRSNHSHLVPKLNPRALNLVMTPMSKSKNDIPSSLYVKRCSGRETIIDCSPKPRSLLWAASNPKCCPEKIIKETFKINQVPLEDISYRDIEIMHVGCVVTDRMASEDDQLKLLEFMKRGTSVARLAGHVPSHELLVDLEWQLKKCPINLHRTIVRLFSMEAVTARQILKYKALWTNRSNREICILSEAA